MKDLDWQHALELYVDAVYDCNRIAAFQACEYMEQPYRREILAMLVARREEIRRANLARDKENA